MSTPDLSVIIPVHNAADTIEGVVESFLGLDGVSAEVILIDDKSSDGSSDLLDRLAEQHDGITALHHRVNRGAGVARNTGFAHAQGRYTIFFDADDVLHPDAVEMAVPELDESAASIALFTYHYERKEGQHQGMNEADIAVFSDYLGNAPQRIGRLSDMPRLLAVSNYPWNRILRTEIYRDAGIKFGTTPVHNDVLGHWYSLLFADSILMLNHEICTHIVAEGGGNLTNQQSAVRLTLFDALDETYDLLEQHPHLRNRYSHHYWAGVIRIANWARSRISPWYVDEFNLRYQEHLARIDLGDFARIRLRRDPALATAILRRSMA